MASLGDTSGADRVDRESIVAAVRQKLQTVKVTKKTVKSVINVREKWESSLFMAFICKKWVDQQVAAHGVRLAVLS
ncbi:hypothetical protein DSCO28_56950 [Desulfosarcina ovata subsp. sediminis]|nr:hypothetical protein DSCO28_56950 [Desulfosarcina ovata subsp. sediminis]